jgi:hypothetical protein
LSADPVELRNDRGSSDFDVRHSLSAAVTYDIPTAGQNHLIAALLRNWSVGSILITRTATPISNVFACDFDLLLSNGACPRPDLIAGVPLYVEDPTVAAGRRLNQLAFAFPTPGRQGTLGRNALRGFPVFQLDMSLRRNLKLTERLELQLSAEFFNILNHPNFGDPEAILSGDPEADALFFGHATQMLGQSLSPGGALGETGSAGFNPIFQLGGPRSVQLAVRLKF